jgi:deoxyadenosine/deoxycytidine kinase
MAGVFSINDTINTLNAIFEKHQHERIVVLTTTCVGKTEMIKLMPQWIDADVLLGQSITDEEIIDAIQSQKGVKYIRIYEKKLYKKIKITPGIPVFGSCVIDCDVLVYLDISEKNLLSHCQKRGRDFNFVLELKEEIENDWNYHKERNDKIFYYVVMAE